MAANDWINGYLEAILDVGSSLRKRNEGKLNVVKFEDSKEKEDKSFSPTKYFVEEVINSFDESDLHRTWVKIAWDDAQRLARRQLELEQGRNDAADDLSELSEGEKEKGDANFSEPELRSVSMFWMVGDQHLVFYIYLGCPA